MKIFGKGMASLVLAFMLAGCGPIIGAGMYLTTGVKEFQVKQGSPSDFHAVKKVLVFAPMEKEEGAFFISRGEDEANLALEMEKEGLFATEFYMERNYEKGPQTLAAFREKTPEELQSQLKLKWAPDAILSGRILARDHSIAPAFGMIQSLTLRLDLFNLRTKKVASVEIAVKEIHQQTIPMIVKELKRRTG